MQKQAFTAIFKEGWPNKATSDKSFLIHVNLSFVLTSNDCNMWRSMRHYVHHLVFYFCWLAPSTESEIYWLEVLLHIAVHKKYLLIGCYFVFSHSMSHSMNKRVTAITCLGQFVWKGSTCSTTLGTPVWIFLTLKTFWSSYRLKIKARG